MRWMTVWLFPVVALAQTVPPRSFFSLPSSNGHGAVMVDARAAKVVHFRERLPATEEPLLDAQRQEVWVGNQPHMVRSRDLLFDAYFGLRAGGQQQWLSQPAPDASGYDTAAPSPSGGSGILTWHQQALGLDATTFVFAPKDFAHAGFVMALRLENRSASPVSGVSAFSLHNFHLGFGRPGVMQKLAANGETVVISNRDVLERAFAGVVVARPVGSLSRVAAWTPSSSGAENAFQVVNQGGASDLVDRSGDLGVADDWAHAFQFDVGLLQPGASAWVAVVVAHHADPFAGSLVQGWLDAFVGTKSAQALVEAERTAWASFQQSLTVPPGLSPDEETVLRQSAVILHMAQVQEETAFLREALTRDGEPRFTRFPLVDGGTDLPAEVRHRGRGAVLASLPPGEWTYAWVRDGAYAAAALARLGLTTQSREALRFFLDAEGGRFRDWNELRPYAFPPYLLSLTRYVGFGVEETDFNDFGPNLELDGFGLFLWALREHERRTGDTSLADARWDDIVQRVAEPLVALIDPASGLLRKDSSIWETHWNGRERTWTYTNLTAVRGLCDAAAIAERRGDTAHAQAWRQTARALRQAIASSLTDGAGALASNREELQSGNGYFDAAVLDAIALGLFHPSGRVATSTLAALDAHLQVAAGPGWARNDDRTDHGGGEDLSPWGSEYDSAEWTVTDLRGALALRAAGQAFHAKRLEDWVTQQAVVNAGIIPETFDEQSGGWKFNAPMVGFGAGVYVLALAGRAAPVDPACGAFDDAPASDGGVDAGGLDAGAPDAGPTVDAGRPDASPGDAGPLDGGSSSGMKPTGCGCAGADGSALGGLLLALGLARRRRVLPPHA